MMVGLKLRFILLLCLCIVTPGLSVSVKTMLGMEEDSTEFAEERQLHEEEIEEDENEVDPRLTKEYPENSMGPYECSSTSQCANGGECIDTGNSGKICNCTQGFLGPYCDYSASSIDRALRVHDLFKVSFAECMTKTGQTAGVDAASLFENCGGGQNICWLHEGGVKGLKCLFWCLTNSMRLSLTEAKPADESRLQLYADVYQKFAHERHLPGNNPSPKPKGAPVASLQINFYDISSSSYPFPRHNTVGIPKMSVKPTVTSQHPDETTGPYGPPPGGPYGSPYQPPQQLDENFVYPKSHEIPMDSDSDYEMGPVDENSFSPLSWELEPSNPVTPEMPGKNPEEGDSPDKPHTPSRNFLNEALHNYMSDLKFSVVESSDDDNEESEDTPMTSYEEDPMSEPLSNMRDGSKR